jgi:hypothetical protein
MDNLCLPNLNEENQWTKIITIAINAANIQSWFNKHQHSLLEMIDNININKIFGNYGPAQKQNEDVDDDDNTTIINNNLKSPPSAPFACIPSSPSPTPGSKVKQKCCCVCQVTNTKVPGTKFYMLARSSTVKNMLFLNSSLKSQRYYCADFYRKQ